jgi:hypothetical protein
VPNVLDRYQELAVQALTSERPPSRGAIFAGVLILALLLGLPTALLMKRISSTQSCEPAALIQAIEREDNVAGSIEEIDVRECRSRYARVVTVSPRAAVEDEQFFLRREGDRWTVISAPASVSGRF